MANIKNGWHDIAGYRVWVEDGRVLRGLNLDGDKTTYPYRWNGDGWTNDAGLTVNAFRAGVKRDTIKMA